MSHHACEHVMVPSHVFSDLIVILTQLGLGLFEALLDRPSQATEPDQHFESDAGEGIADKVVIFKVIIDGSSDQQPYGFLRHPLADKTTRHLVNS